MTEPFLGEIQMFGFNFNPRGWAYCSGALLPISQNTALFSLLGTTYGGDGRTTFQLPNFTSRAVCGNGQGLGLSDRPMGDTFGQEAVTLGLGQIPQHGHGMVLYSQNDPAKRTGSPTPGSALSVPSSAAARAFLPNGTPGTNLANNMLQPSPGTAQPHSNQQPYLAMNFCIALQGIFPPRS